jgi:hypothetical protein
MEDVFEAFELFLWRAMVNTKAVLRGAWYLGQEYGSWTAISGLRYDCE